MNIPVPNKIKCSKCDFSNLVRDVRITMGDKFFVFVATCVTCKHVGPNWFYDKNEVQPEFIPLYFNPVFDTKDERCLLCGKHCAYRKKCIE